MPLVFRAMKKDDDDRPTVEPSAKGLGVRPGEVDIDEQGNVIANGRGMSVAPAWRMLPPFRIPERLRDRMPKARGSNEIFCFRHGDGPFLAGPIASTLTLEPDSPNHGCIAPLQDVSINEYQSALAATRDDWTIDEA